MNDMADGRKPGQGGGERAIHPGKGRRNALLHPKGRVLADADVAGVKSSSARGLTNGRY